MSRKSAAGRGGTGGSRQKPKHEPIVRGQLLQLGDLSGEEVLPVVATFGYFGETFTVNPLLSEVDIIDFMDDASRVSNDSPEGIMIVKSFGRRVVAEEDFDKFWATARANRQGGEALMAVLWKVLDGVTARPTSPPSDSSDGRPATSPSSPPAVSRAGDVRAGAVIDAEPLSVVDDDPMRARFLAQIERFEKAGNVAVATQIAVAAEARGVNVTRDPSLAVSA